MNLWNYEPFEKLLYAISFQKEGVLEFPGGVPTSLTKSGQQWDYPNAWPPLQDIVIETLRQSDVEEANDYALKLAQNWTLTNWRAYKETDLMFEKVLLNLFPIGVQLN